MAEAIIVMAEAIIVMAESIIVMPVLYPSQGFKP
jgi:hypothetical protein